MADIDNGYGGRTPSPRRDAPPQNYGQERRNDGPPPRRQDGPDGNAGNNLHVSGLASRTTDDDLRDIFGKFGKVDSAQIMRDPHTKDSRGFGFVNFELAEDAQAAMDALNATTLDDKTITVAKARRGRPRSPTPGQYQGTVKARSAGYRPYEGRRDDRYGGDRRDDRRGPPPSYGGGYSMAAPMRSDSRYDDRRGGGGGYGGGYPDRRDDRRDYRQDDRDRRDYGRRDYNSGGGDRRDRDYDQRRY